MTPQIVSFDREAVALRFACPDASRMRWRVYGDRGAQCSGCPAGCGQSIPLPGQQTSIQPDLFAEVLQ